MYVNGIPDTINIPQSYNLSCNTFYWETGCIEEEYYLYHGDELISRNRSFMLRANSVSDILSNHFCTVTVNGNNFTSNPAHTPKSIQCKYQAALITITAGFYHSSCFQYLALYQ